MNREIKVGIFVIGSLVIFYIGLNFLKGYQVFSSKNRYHVFYDNCHGLSLGDPVLLNGLIIGRIKKIQLAPELSYKILVSFDIEKKIQLYHSTLAKIINYNLLGSKAIALFIGDDKDNLLMHSDTLPGIAGDDIQEMFMDTFMPLLNEIKNTSTVLHSFIQNLSVNQTTISHTIDNVEKITEELKNTIIESKKNFNIINQQLTKAIEHINNDQNGIQPLLTKFNCITDQFVKTEIFYKAQAILNNIEQALDPKKNKTGTLSRLLYQDSVYNAINKSLLDADKLLIDFKKNPKRYINFSIFGKKYQKK